MKTLFIVDRSTDLATNEIRKESAWALSGEAILTVKFEGTAALYKDGILYKRWDRRLTKKYMRLKNRLGSDFVAEEHMFKETPSGAIPCEDKPDPVTFHHPHWVPVTDGNEDAMFREALANAVNLVDGATYELVGPKIQGNMYNLDKHELWMHGSKVIEDKIDLSFDGIKNWLRDNEVEGIVFHHPDGRMTKVRRKDMFDFRKLEGGRKVDWRDDNIIPN